MKKYLVNGEVIETNNLKKDYPHLFKSHTYVWEMATGKTYLFVNDYAYRKIHYFTDAEKDFLANIYGENLHGLGSKEKVVAAGSLENGIYTISNKGVATKVA